MKRKKKTIESATLRREMFEVMQLRNRTKKMQTTHAKRTKNKEVTDKKKRGRGFLLLSYKRSLYNVLERKTMTLASSGVV